MIIENIEEILEYSFGLSIYTFFRNIESYNENMNFEEHKKAFFQILECLLNRRAIMLTKPDADIYRTPTHIPKFTIDDKEAQWDISPENAVQHFQERWPENASDSNDEKIIHYLYAIPGIIWVADDGSLHAS